MDHDIEKLLAIADIVSARIPRVPETEAEEDVFRILEQARTGEPVSDHEYEIALGYLERV